MAIKICNIPDSEIVWTDLEDPTAEELRQISETYNLNTYALTDSEDPDHLPKHEEHNDIHFIIVRTLQDEDADIQNVKNLSSKIAIFHNHGFVVTIHRCSQPLITSIRQDIGNQKISTSVGIVIRIVRETLNTYHRPALQLSDNIDYYESKLFLKKNFPADLIQAIYFLKNRAGVYRKLLMLTNEVVGAIKAEGEDKPALRDVRDLHTKLVLLYDQIQDEANHLMNTYLSLSAQKTNDVVKILTIFSVFFMPLTFIVGIYGMNFKYMPELDNELGYPVTLLAMAIVSVIIFIWFKRKKWL